MEEGNGVFTYPIFWKRDSIIRDKVQREALNFGGIHEMERSIQKGNAAARHQRR
jgi:hypothetical protein